MSVGIMDQVWKRSTQKGTALLMLLAIADTANDEGAAYPSIGTLARKCRMSERNAQMLITKIEASMELEVKKGEGRVKRGGPTNLFIIHVDRMPAVKVVKPTSPGEAHFTTSEGVKPTSPGEAHFTTSEGVKPTSPGEIQRRKGVKPTSPNPSINRDEIEGKDEIDFFLIWDHHIGSPLSDGDRHMIAELHAAGLPRDVWDAALRRAVQTRKARVAGSPMPIAYVLKCITSIQAERDAAREAVDRAFAPMVAPVTVADEPDEREAEWSQLLDGLDITAQDRAAWFAGSRLVDVAGDVGIVSVPNVFVRDEISLRFMSQLRAGLSRMSGRPMTVELVFS